MGLLECPHCGSKDVININLAMERGDPVSFFSCHRCEKRWWRKDEENLALTNVLELAKRDRKRV